MPTMTINGHKLDVEFARTADERAAGLSNRESMPNNQGMLFIFESPGKYGFWMKDMKFSLDFVWIKDGKVVEIMPNIGFTDQTTIYQPKSEIDSVLEVNAGWAAKNGIKIGDRAEVD